MDLLNRQSKGKESGLSMSEFDKVNVTDTVIHPRRIPGMPFQRIRELKDNSGIPEYTIRQLLKKGQLPGFYSGNRFMVDVSRFEELLETLSK